MPDFNIDPSVLGKRAHARVFDQTVMICRRESNRLIHQNFKNTITKAGPKNSVLGWKMLILIGKTGNLRNIAWGSH
ncbi:MAG: hypothetical protein GY839_00535 [candidate division Zixibacteria bacterium]|nr:hypothetical protein [candidate division Zixibacteria bacterium]